MRVNVNENWQFLVTLQEYDQVLGESNKAVDFYPFHSYNLYTEYDF